MALTIAKFVVSAPLCIKTLPAAQLPFRLLTCAAHDAPHCLGSLLSVIMSICQHHALGGPVVCVCAGSAAAT
jgi:hypothetical protein